MKVHEVMSRGVECVRPDDTLQQAARKMRDLDVGSMPVCDNDRLAGMITDRDLAVRAVAEGWDPKQRHVRDVLSEGVVYCFDDQDVEEAGRVMRERQIRRLVVLNRDKRMVGIVALGDLATKPGAEDTAGKALEEISEPAGAAH